MLKRVALVLLIVLVSWAYQATRLPPPKLCGSPSGPPVTGPRIKLRDGRHLAYKENGVPKDKARYKIILLHGFSSCRHEAGVLTSVPQDVVEELGVYAVGFDRPGYGESDPDPKRTVKSLALDIEELGDQLELGSKFYVMGNSMGGQAVWGCLKYIPNRLLGAGLTAPVTNYWWPSFPANLSTEAYYKQPPQDQWAFRVAHYLPCLTYWWNTQKLFPASTAIARIPDMYSPRDLVILKKLLVDPNMNKCKVQATQQGVFESFHRELMVVFGSWEFSPMNLKNPFPNNEGSVHLWQGDEDRPVPITLQRYIVSKLPWIQFHELAGHGHLFPGDKGMGEAILKEFLVGKK